jgi:hypothetical protein
LQCWSFRHAHGEIEAEKLAVLAEKMQVGLHDRADLCLDRQVLLDRGVDLFHEVVDRGLEGLLDELVAVAEIEIDGAFGDTGFVRDFLHRRCGHPFAGDDAHRRVLNGLDAVLLDDFFFRFGDVHGR